jgi:hypothetical protein
MRNGRYIAALALLLAAFFAAEALAASSYSAHARRPAFDDTTLELVGKGSYRSARPHSELRVTVCLRKRTAGRFFDVRCETASAAGKRVKAQVSVPGCVAGLWRTSSVGEALGRGGGWIKQASAASKPFRC